jgi:hypothetical protein
MALPNRISLSPGLLWLTLNLTLIIQCLSRNNIFVLNVSAYPIRCLWVPPWVCVPHVENHCSIFYGHMSTRYALLLNFC